MFTTYTYFTNELWVIVNIKMKSKLKRYFVVLLLFKFMGNELFIICIRYQMITKGYLFINSLMIALYEPKKCQ